MQQRLIHMVYKLLHRHGVTKATGTKLQFQRKLQDATTAIKATNGSTITITGIEGMTEINSRKRSYFKGRFLRACQELL